MRVLKPAHCLLTLAEIWLAGTNLCSCLRCRHLYGPTCDPRAITAGRSHGGSSVSNETFSVLGSPKEWEGKLRRGDSLHSGELCPIFSSPYLPQPRKLQRLWQLFVFHLDGYSCCRIRSLLVLPELLVLVGMKPCPWHAGGLAPS